MCEILTAPNIERTGWLLKIYWNLSPTEKEKYDRAEEEFGSHNLEEVEQFMEDYFRERGLLAS